MIRGESVTVLVPTITYDADTKDEVITYESAAVDNMLFGTPSTDEADEAMRLYSVNVQYKIHVPKTYTGSLRGCKVYRPRDGVTYSIVGDPPQMPPELCPLAWNREALAVVFDG